jgi:hypothetical protein
VQSATVTIRYGASAGYVAYRWQRLDDGLRLRWTGSGDGVTLRLLLPADAPSPATIRLDGIPQPASIRTIGQSRYVEIVAGGSGTIDVRWL